MDKHPVEYISTMQDLVDLHEWVDDEKFTDALELATKVIAKPELPPAHARQVLLLMQAYSLHFKMRAQLYTHIHKGKTGSPENIKKNVFHSMAEECHQMAQTLKYLSRDAQ